jgi:hypothetical protein
MRFVDPSVIDTRQLALLGRLREPSPPATLMTPYANR